LNLAGKSGNRPITITTDNLDTRQKIVSPAEAGTLLRHGNWLVIAASFDPVTPSVAARLNDLVSQGHDEKVLAVVLDSPETLLSKEARSVLVAALRLVDAVTPMPQQDLSNLIPQEPRIRFVFDAETERRNSAEFSELVLGKQALLLADRELVP
jgi:hypothetical protein